MMLKVYYSDISDLQVPDDEISLLSNERREYIKSIKNEKSRKQSYYVWLLLERAVKELFPDGNNFNYCVSEGKWECVGNPFYFGLSHSCDIVAVALSDTDSVGIDVEKISDKIIKLKDKLLKASEKEYFKSNKGKNNEAEKLTFIWCRKESRYKRGKDGIFSEFTVCGNNSEEYSLIVCGNRQCDEISKITLK